MRIWEVVLIVGLVFLVLSAAALVGGNYLKTQANVGGILDLPDRENTHPVLGDPWDEASQSAYGIYGPSAEVTAENEQEIVDKLNEGVFRHVWRGPPGIHLSPGLLELAYRCSSSGGSSDAWDYTISTGCMAAYPNDIFRQMSCSANLLGQLFEETEEDENCRNFYIEGLDVLGRLENKDVELNVTPYTMLLEGFFDGGWHIAMKVEVIPKSGQDSGKKFSYIHDSGWFPDTFFPADEFTENWHANNPGKFPTGGDAYVRPRDEPPCIGLDITLDASEGDTVEIIIRLEDENGNQVFDHDAGVIFGVRVTGVGATPGEDFKLGDFFVIRADSQVATYSLVPNMQGETVVTIEILEDDDYDEDIETIRVELFSPKGASLCPGFDLIEFDIVNFDWLIDESPTPEPDPGGGGGGDDDGGGFILFVSIRLADIFRYFASLLGRGPTIGIDPIGPTVTPVLPIAPTKVPPVATSTPLGPGYLTPVSPTVSPGPRAGPGPNLFPSPDPITPTGCTEDTAFCQGLNFFLELVS